MQSMIPTCQLVLPNVHQHQYKMKMIGIFIPQFFMCYFTIRRVNAHTVLTASSVSQKGVEDITNLKHQSPNLIF